VYSLRVYSSSLAVGGTFTTIGGATVNRIARWNGTSWATIGSGFNNGVYALYVNGTTLFAGGTFDNADFQPAYRIAYYNGAGWQAAGSGLSGNGNTCKAITVFAGNNICAGSFSMAGGNLANNIASWGAPLGIKPIDLTIPDKYMLGQNYPNPFNPSTKIRFGIPSKNAGQDIKIVLYDMLGREVTTIVNVNLAPGVYEVDFNSDNLTTGTYFYRFIASDYTETKKMIIVK